MTTNVGLEFKMVLRPELEFVTFVQVRSSKFEDMKLKKLVVEGDAIGRLEARSLA